MVNWHAGEAPSNVWFIVSVENQETADKRILELLPIPAKVRGLSVEPMLGLIDFQRPYTLHGGYTLDKMPGIDWVIFGGESGCGARDCHADWIRDGVRQCKDAGIQVFVKQLGGFCVIDESTRDAWPAGTKLVKGCKENLRLVLLKHPKGGDPAEWPTDLRVREFPNP
jgi:protein gp37